MAVAALIAAPARAAKFTPSCDLLFKSIQKNHPIDSACGLETYVQEDGRRYAGVFGWRTIPMIPESTFLEILKLIVAIAGGIGLAWY